MFAMASLLVHSPFVPIASRAALREAHESPPEMRAERLESAARMLLRETDLPCADVRELIDATPGECAP
jgi:hypothetical protein